MQNLSEEKQFELACHIFDSRKKFFHYAKSKLSLSKIETLIENEGLKHLYDHMIQVQLAYKSFEEIGIVYDYDKVFRLNSSEPDGTRLNQIFKWINRHEKEGLIHPEYNLTGTETGRITSIGFPFANLDNKREVRELFIARADHQYLYLDYSQAEIIVAAYMFDSEEFLSVLNENDDLYQYFGDLWGGLERKPSKDVLISSIYGCGPELVSKIAKVPREAAIMMQSLLFFNFPKIRDWIGYIRHTSRNNKFISSPFKRRRNSTGLSDQAIMNFPVQSSLADIKMIVIRELYEKGLSKHIRLDFHDGLVFEIPNDKFNEISKQIYVSMVKPNIEKYFKGNKLKEIKLPVKLYRSNSLNFEK
jgi:DNA polymerase I-like protein with 3'-5' exonuclease and polymerase domains